MARELNKGYRLAKNHKETNNLLSDYRNSLKQKNLAGFIRIKLLVFLKFLERESCLSTYNIANIIEIVKERL